MCTYVPADTDMNVAESCTARALLCSSADLSGDDASSELACESVELDGVAACSYFGQTEALNACSDAGSCTYTPRNDCATSAVEVGMADVGGVQTNGVHIRVPLYTASIDTGDPCALISDVTCR